MSYLSFRVTLIFTSSMGILMMIAKENYDFLFFPIVMFIWAFYTFFEEDDKEYRRRNGEYHTIGSSGVFNYDDDTWLYSGATYPERNRHSTIRYDNRTKNDPAYKKVPKKYKRTLKITVYNGKDDDEKS